MFKQILIAVDDSEPAARAVELGGGLASSLGARLALVYVADTAILMAAEGGVSPTDLRADARREGEQLLSRLAAG